MPAVRTNQPTPPVRDSATWRDSTSSERAHFQSLPSRPYRRRTRSSRRRRHRGRWLVRLILILLGALLILVLWEGVAFSADEPKRGAFAWELPAGTNSTVVTPPVATLDPGRAPTAAGASPPTPATETDSTTAPAPELTFAQWLIQLVEEDERRRSASQPAATTAPPDAESQTVPAPTEAPPPDPPSGLPRSEGAPAGRRPVNERPAATTTPSPASSPLIAPPELLGVQTVPSGFDGDPIVTRGLAEFRDDALSFTSTLDLVVALEAEFRNLPGDEVRDDPATLRSDLYHRIIELSVQVGFTDNPRDNLDAIRTHLNGSLRIQAVARARPDLDLLRAAKVLRTHRASETGWALLALCLAERLNSYLDLEPVEAGGILALRYRSGAHRYVLIPLHPEKLHTEQELLGLAYGPELGSHEIRLLTKKQLWGRVFGEAGAALLEREGEVAHAAEWIERGLNLYRDQPLAHIAHAQIMAERNDLPSALEAVDLAVSIDPHDATARLRRAELLVRLGLEDRLVEDLRWLSREGKNARSALQLVRLLVRRSDFVPARMEVERLRGLELPPSLAADLAAAEKEVLATPWVEVLRSGRFTDAERFEAIDRMSAHPIPVVQRALADTLDDANLRLAQYAARSLQRMTGLELPPIRERWLDALRLRKN